MLMSSPVVPLLVMTPGVSWHSDGALSRAQPGELKHGFGVIPGSLKVSNRTDVSSTPHWLSLFRGPFSAIPLPAGVDTIASVKSPAQLVPFRFWNCGLARLVVPGDEYSCSSGGFSSLESRLPLASDW